MISSINCNMKREGGERKTTKSRKREGLRGWSEVTVFGRVTAGQEGLYVIWKTNPAATNYTTVLELEWAVRAEGLKEVVKRHSALRTRRLLQSGGAGLVLQEAGKWDSIVFLQETSRPKERKRFTMS